MLSTNSSLATWREHSNSARDYLIEINHDGQRYQAGRAAPPEFGGCRWMKGGVPAASCSGKLPPNSGLYTMNFEIVVHFVMTAIFRGSHFLFYFGEAIW